MAAYFHTLLILSTISVGNVKSFTFTRLPLDGSGWTVTEASRGVKVNAFVPGSMYTALVDAAVITNPLYRFNDVNYTWVGNADWTYSRTFTVSSSLISAGQALLVCEGLDTIATVLINGQEVGRGENMFVRYVFDVTKQLRGGDNSITIKFSSAVREALDRVNHSSYVIPPECPPPAQHGQCHVNQIRKEQCSFSWDWGPSFPTQGIWKPIYLQFINNAIIRRATGVVRKVNSRWQVFGEVHFDVVGEAPVRGQLTTSILALNVSSSQIVTVTDANTSAPFTLTVPETTNVPLWWPNGYGEQPLFDVDVTFTAGSDKSSQSFRIGFRTVEVIQDPVSSKTEDGLTFYFKVNGIPIYLKGSNWIPADSFQEKVNNGRLRYLLESAANVSMNAMRVWGGGVFESDDFYDICDELGILIWQDFMFSVAMYPTYLDFLYSVGTEVAQQIRRLKPHPCILVWAGNNENEKGLRQDWFGTGKNFSLYYNDYIELYVKTVMPIVESEDSSRDYLVSSPSNGKESDQEGYVAKDPGSELYGDIHFYDYAADQWNASVFRIPRMASEYGIQAWCNVESLATVFAPEDYDISSALVDHRQHHTGGNMEMLAEVGIHLNIPTAPDLRTNFEQFIYLTQINQAMSIRTQTEHYRRFQSRLLSDGRGLTMGALYWQLNDIWQAPTWASIDYEGGWKMLHYYAKSFFNKTLISPYLMDPDTLDVYMVIDEIPILETRNPSNGQLSFQPMSELTDITQSGLSASQTVSMMQIVRQVVSGFVKMDILNYNSFKPMFSWTVPYNLNTTAESVLTRKVSTLLQESGCPSVRDCMLYFTATDHSGQVLSTSWYPLAYPKVSNLPSVSLMITSVTTSDMSTFDIEISGDAIALFVWLSAGTVRGHFSDNGFPLLSPTRTVQFFATSPMSVAQVTANLKVHSIVDVKATITVIG